jgi:hypothetical protein
VEKTKADVNQQRFDYYDAATWLTQTFTATPEGFLRGRAVVTNVGVFTYRNADGTIHTELRLPEEVFDSESLDSLRMKPLTNNHPDELVTPENIKNYQVGSLGDNPGSTTQVRDYNGSYVDRDKLTDGYHLAIDMCITEQNAIADVKNGKRALSCGYTCDLEKAEDGAKWCGVPYDFIQRHIRYNHVAIVDSARAGDEAKIRMDSGAWILDTKKSKLDEGGKDIMTMKKVNLDGVEYEAEAPVIAALTKATERADKADKELERVNGEFSIITADRDTFKEKAEKLDKDLTDLKNAAPDKTKLDEAVDAKIRLLQGANLAGVEIKDGMADLDVRKAVIQKVFPNANFDGKDEIYVMARFDGAMEILQETNKNDASTRAIVGGAPIPAAGNGTHSDSTQFNADASRQKMMKDMEAISRGQEVK